MRKFPGLIAVSAIVLAGCNLSSDLPTTQRLGFITVSQYGEGDTATIDVLGSFFQPSATVQPNIPNTAGVPDTCNVYDYQGPPDDQGPIKLDNLNAGDSIVIKTDKATGKLVPIVNMAGSVDYRLATGRLPFTPGSKITIVIPGDSGGFPAHTDTVSTFVAPTFTPIERHPTDDLSIHWSGGGATYGAMQLEFLYSNTESTAPNKGMLCMLRDDGNYTIPRFVVGGEWESSPDDAQSVTAVRWNTTLQQDRDVLLDILVRLQPQSVPLTAPDTAAAADLAAASIR
ncbi:MAG TPA: hypothetical protein VFT57_10980 [Gemmatimonadaceae bacterium]|jgi:hypothetical protein|nr:hypothetical protein [Gemmatimonadaceae bacterium]